MPTQPPGFVARFLAVLDTLRAFLAQVPGEDLRFGSIALSSRIWLDRVGEGISRLVARIQAGPLPPLLPRRVAPLRPARITPPSLCPDPLARPNTFAWLVRELPRPEKPLVVQALRELLADPELHPFLAAEPARFTRLLRPLCLAMGLPLPEPLRTEPARLATPDPQSAPAPAVSVTARTWAPPPPPPPPRPPSPPAERHQQPREPARRVFEMA